MSKEQYQEAKQMCEDVAKGLFDVLTDELGENKLYLLGLLDWDVFHNNKKRFYYYSQVFNNSPCLCLDVDGVAWRGCIRIIANQDKNRPFAIYAEDIHHESPYKIGAYSLENLANALFEFVEIGEYISQDNPDYLTNAVKRQIKRFEMDMETNDDNGNPLDAHFIAGYHCGMFDTAIEQRTKLIITGLE